MGLLIICGAAKCLWNDLARIPEDVDAAWMGVNVAGVFVPHPISYLVSLHPEHAEEYKSQRRALGYPGTCHTIAHKGFPDILIRHNGERGGSGLYAVRCGLELGYDRIVLAGMPTDSQRYFFDLPKMESLLPRNLRIDPVRADAYKRRWVGDAYQKTWRLAESDLKPYVRSMSGYTARLLGEPDTEYWRQ